MNYGILTGPDPSGEERARREERIGQEITPIAEDMFPDDVGWSGRFTSSSMAGLTR